MSWIIEPSDDASSAISIQGNTVACQKEGFYGSPINVLWKDPAENSGLYYWQIEFIQLDEQGSVSVGLTTQDHFKAGYAIKAIEYNGNLADGSALLVGSFGDRIKRGDNIGILLNLTDSDMKVHLFLNERPLGLAFHVQAPFPKPLFPVVSFSTNGEATIVHSKQIPTSLNRQEEHFDGIEGHWKLVDYPQHSDCTGYNFHLFKKDGTDDNIYCLSTRVINSMTNNLTHDSSTNQWKSHGGMQTLMGGDQESMRKEDVISKLINGITGIELQGQQLVMTSNGNEVKLERYTPEPPKAYTKNVFAGEY
ncbi:unnamed protein product [Rotaria sordida]|uniref:B30.2/SPRY domain-containing protein n=1 Tax=Rotaria sordida TaxID=392033 RepID=A0A814QEE3_9BILA|nr:unnamed protein product [Rotaria sordida]